MCCSREHYPTTVGIHQVGDNDHHTHLVLPWARLNHVVCITDESPLKLVWRDFNGSAYPTASASVYTAPEDTRKVNDLLIVAIAESGRCGHNFFKALISRYNRRLKSGAAADYTGASGTLEFKPPPPEEIEEWHEWLVKVAKSEANDYQRMMAMEKAMHEAHPELGA